MSASPFIENPILRGFNPDPSILRVGEDYYIATSTFEWFPGVQIHHSRDLVHWRLLTHPLRRQSQLNLLGNLRSGGIWAPCLSYSDGSFYLIFTDVKSWGRRFSDHHNYLVTAENIEGPWSEPTFLNASGFDPSLFHDDDGRKWFVNVCWDFRPGRNLFGGILLQEFDPQERRLIGAIKNICGGSQRGLTEAPHLYKHAGRYYLLLAEGGTSWEHAAIFARADAIEGPYELDPDGPLLTSEGTDAELQKAGHASLVETADSRWYLAHLCGRPIGERRCPLGRETALQEVRWNSDGWLKLASGGTSPSARVSAPSLPPWDFPAAPVRDDFSSPELGLHYQTLRVPAEQSWLSLRARPGTLRLVGRESPSSRHRQSLVARRRQAMHVRFETKVEFSPENFQQLAGLIAYYDDENFIYLAVTKDEQVGRCLSLLVCRLGELEDAGAGPIALPPEGAVILRAEFSEVPVQFSWALSESGPFSKVGEALDSTLLSDDHTTIGIGFTGTFVGMCAQDLSGGGKFADFHYFECEESDGVRLGRT